MQPLLTLWKRLSRGARIGLASGCVLIVGGAVVFGTWLLRTDYDVLFSGMSPQDSSAIVAELERLKVPYRIDPESQAILVPADEVARTRMKVMTRELPLQGAVGFEVFNNADFGMTEFVQKVNYQRALQGELTRTILSIDAVHSARVHLAIPEQGLFRKAGENAGKASVTLGLKPGRQLTGEQVQGIQRLVAASVPDLQAAAVTVMDQEGRALSANGDVQDVGASAGASLDLKRHTEEYLSRKVNAVLDRALGAGEAMATVDVTLNLDQVRVTTEEVLAARNGSADNPPAGVMVRERQTARETPPADPTSTAKPSTRGAQSVEIDYQTGHRTEQSVVTPGSIRLLNVAVVVKHPMDVAATDRLREIVATAVGLNRQRGDAIAVNSLAVLVGTDPAAGATSSPATSTPAAVAHAEKQAGAPFSMATLGAQGGSVPAALVGGAVLLLLAAGIVSVASRRRLASLHLHEPVVVLTESQREQMLGTLGHWLDAPAAGGALTTRSL